MQIKLSQMKKLFLQLYLLTFMLSPLTAQTTYTSTGNGNWDTSGIWNSNGTGNPIKYIIQSSHSINANVNVTGMDEIEVNGSLTFNTVNRRLTLNSGGIVKINTGGQITGGNGSNRIIIGNNTMQGNFNQSGPAYADSSTTGFTVGMLPVELSKLKVLKDLNSKTVTIQWETVSEENNSHFEVQRSINLKDWVIVAVAEGNGNSQLLNKYEAMDINPEKQNYYRLKQVDFDGNFSLSDVVEAHFEALKPLHIAFYPNPAEQILSIQVPNQDEVTVDIMTIEGKLINNMQYSMKDNYQIDLDISNLVSGLYILKISTADKMVCKRFVKK